MPINLFKIIIRFSIFFMLSIINATSRPPFIFDKFNIIRLVLVILPLVVTTALVFGAITIDLSYFAKLFDIDERITTDPAFLIVLFMLYIFSLLLLYALTTTVLLLNTCRNGLEKEAKVVEFFIAREVGVYGHLISYKALYMKYHYFVEGKEYVSYKRVIPDNSNNNEDYNLEQIFELVKRGDIPSDGCKYCVKKFTVYHNKRIKGIHVIKYDEDHYMGGFCAIYKKLTN